MTDVIARVAGNLSGRHQWIALKWIYPWEGLLVAFLLGFVPYVLVRGLVNRLARLWMRRGAHV